MLNHKILISLLRIAFDCQIVKRFTNTIQTFLLYIMMSQENIDRGPKNYFFFIKSKPSDRSLTFSHKITQYKIYITEMFDLSCFALQRKLFLCFTTSP